MGQSRDGGQLAGKLLAAGAAAVQINRTATAAAAMVVKRGTLAEASKASGGDLRLSNWKRAGKMNVGFDVNGSGPSVRAVVTPRPAGVWRVVNDGAGEHTIRPKVRGRRRRALKIGDGFAAYAPHPGTRGTGAWDKGVDRSRKPALERYRQEQVKGIVGVFG